MSAPRPLPLRIPVTLLSVIGIFVLLGLVELHDSGNSRKADSRHAYGAATPRTMPGHPELRGQFDLWDGAWWRMLVSGFHHVDFWHVFGNAIGLIYLGTLLELRIGSVRMLVFLIVGTFVSLLPCFLIGQTVVGISGGVYALFGLLVVMRLKDEELSELLPLFMVLLFLLYLPAGIILKELGLLRVSNLGHAAGLVYGMLAGVAFFPPTERPVIHRRWFVAAHILIVPMVYMIVHPTGNGRYHWRLAVMADGDERLAHLEQAVEVEPDLIGAWLTLAHEYRRRGNIAREWSTRLRAVRFNPRNQRLLRSLNAAWRLAGAEEERIARKQLEEVFADGASDWQSSLAMIPKPRGRVVRKVPWSPTRSALYWPPTDARLFSPPVRKQQAPSIDPNRRDSALHGTTL